MQRKIETRIRIHQPGTRITDANTVAALVAIAPTAFRKAQGVLVAAKKYEERSGLFSSERSRIRRLQSECYELAKALRTDGYLAEDLNDKGEAYVMIEFLSSFSDAFPNWQKEYEALNRFIPLIF